MTHFFVTQRYYLCLLLLTAFCSIIVYLHMSTAMRRMADESFSLASRIKLNNGASMPRIHLGVYLMSGSEASKAVTSALDAGYRAFDSAQMYRNERDVGNSISEYLKTHPEIKREDIHYTSKLASNSDYERAWKSITKSVKECGLGYIDLFLLHSPEDWWCVKLWEQAYRRAARGQTGNKAGCQPNRSTPIQHTDGTHRALYQE
ncbi:putative oxidoreductase C2F3.05c [Pseudocercospora fuligena]|uniref:Putative oxidoreductase C2F3.05c n=1 Tax=Pseudocercospora fuligena TaxID=685502 RepID=A0A8H6RA88_9PEZI|nr:putative oxidoreductase C2F3.05c [Pseudocercospora fuligena]